jgi:very-short-patch-repair endonuclease
MRRDPAIDHRIAELAARQGGVVSRKQLFGLGLSAAAIDHRVRRGQLHPIHHGVYAVGHRLVNARGRLFAALLAVEGSVLSHTTAAGWWDLRPDRETLVHVTVIGDGGRGRRAGIRVHRCALAPEEIDRHTGVALTSPERTLLDVAPMLGAAALEQCLVRAVAAGRFDLRALERLIERSRRRAGVPALRAALAGWSGADAPVRSELEFRFVELCRREKLPRPAVNTRIEGVEVDFAWPDHRVIVELDGFAFHAGRAAFERDRARDAALTLAGWRVLRFSWRQVVGDPRRVAAVVRRALAGPMAG